ncbi:hypothetical protein IMCC26256_11872 [Actinobacteria bacterium IMCC26256]|uniref:Unannotated protein n=1 Tax=freshwater metagenome TaxID=449393 RepID=A0A6J7KZ98_9ZZZZ|nr:hypothetical protein IMCC26256_11872 [Actinobacteria bacterium IMCC26256]
MAASAQELGVNISAAARQGVSDAVRAAMAAADRDAYRQHPESADTFWTEAEAWVQS